MDGLKGFAEVAKHIFYETFGLLIPGALASLVITAAVDPRLPRLLIGFARENPWLAIGAAYVLGYLVQAVSRPINAIAEWVLRSPSMVLAGAGRLLPRLADPVGRWTTQLERSLTGRHAHSRDHGEPRVDLEAIIAAYWRRRLGLATDAPLSEAQVRNLSFSLILGERDGLDRFRAATSLTRTVGTVAVVVLAILVTQVFRAERELTWRLVGVLELLVVAFYGGLERADMYDDLWRSSLRAQFLCTASRAQPLELFVPAAPGRELVVAAASETDSTAIRRITPGGDSADRDTGGTTAPDGKDPERAGRGAEPPPGRVRAPTPAANASTTVSAIPNITTVRPGFSPMPKDDHHA